MKTLNLKPAIFCTLIATSFLATGCNTIQGVGQDLQSVGEKTSEVAVETKS